MKIESREYKLLIDHRPFVATGAAVNGVWAEIEDAARTAPFVIKEGLKEEDSRTVCFLDTPGHTLRRHGLVLRRRVGAEVEYTLKCRSEDRYFAAGTDVTPGDGFDGKPKLEEDIAPPFVCRYSHSATVAGDAKRDPYRTSPDTLRAAAVVFPILGTLHADGLPCRPDTALEVVNGIEVRERVWKGEIEIGVSGPKGKKASVALILWTRAKAEHPAIAELSFRLKDKDEEYRRELAQAARATYVVWQRMDCAQTAGVTKTEYVYRDASRD
jgi:hypothetical protein